MSKEFKDVKVTWQVSDFYVGNHLRYLMIPGEEFEYCESEADRQDVIDLWVQDAFDNNISWGITGTEEV